MGRPPTLVVVGPNRTRRGTGPFLIDAARAAGFTIVGVVATSTASADAAIVRHRIKGARPFEVANLARSLEDLQPSALLVAAPTSERAAHLEIALRWQTPLFIEKPLLPLSTPAAEVQHWFQEFRTRGLPLHLNYYWTFVVNRLRQLDLLPPSDDHMTVHMATPLSVHAMVESAIGHLTSIAMAFGLHDLELSEATEDSTSARYRFVGAGQSTMTASFARVPAPRPPVITVGGTTIHRLASPSPSTVELYRVGETTARLTPSQDALRAFRDAVDGHPVLDRSAAIEQIARDLHDSMVRWRERQRPRG